MANWTTDVVYFVSKDEAKIKASDSVKVQTRAFDLDALVNGSFVGSDGTPTYYKMARLSSRWAGATDFVTAFSEASGLPAFFVWDECGLESHVGGMIAHGMSTLSPYISLAEEQGNHAGNSLYHIFAMRTEEGGNPFNPTILPKEAQEAMDVLVLSTPESLADDSRLLFERTCSNRLVPAQVEVA